MKAKKNAGKCGRKCREDAGNSRHFSCESDNKVNIMQGVEDSLQLNFVENAPET
jgi:hypothetical protein